MSGIRGSFRKLLVVCVECTLVNFKPITEEEFHEVNRFVVPATIARAGWYFDIEECKRICDELGLRQPVEIRYTAGKYTYGAHYPRKRYHRVTLSQDRNLQESINTLLHELRHCKQAEDWSARTGNNIQEFWKEEGHGIGYHGKGYETNVYEVDARGFAELYQLRPILYQARP